MNKIKIIIGMLTVMSCSVYGGDKTVSDITVETDNSAAQHEVFLELGVAKKSRPKTTALTIKITPQDSANDDVDSDDEDSVPALTRVLSPMPIFKKTIFKVAEPKRIPVSELFRSNNGPIMRHFSTSVHNGAVVAMLSNPEENLIRLRRHQDMLATQKPSPRRNALTADISIDLTAKDTDDSK
jgi:hypothetical protein